MFTGINIAESFINSGAASRVMVVSAEYLSPVTTTAQKEISEFMDPRIACLTLGDAGAAIILEAASNNDVGFHELEMYSLTKYSLLCIGRLTEHAHGGPILLVPDPIKHTSIAVEHSVAHSKHTLDRSPWEPEMVQQLIMHQTSERSLLDGARAINKAFGRKICTKENTINNLSERGNTASTSHFVAVWDNILNGRIKSGDNVVFGITGSGQTIGTGTYTFEDLPDRIRSRKQLRQPVEKVEQVNEPLDRISTGRVPRMRVASIGVLSPERSVPKETMPMVKEAVENCLAKLEYDRSDIDLVLFAGVYRTEFISEPALATMIAGELKINDEIRPTDSKRTFAFDVFNGGVSFLNACEVASEMMRSGKIRTALIIASEIENNRDAFPDRLVGLEETASAIVLDQGERSRTGFGEFVFKYLPEELEARTVNGRYADGKACLFLEQDPSIADLYLKMIPEAVNELLKREVLAMSEINVVLPPQFSSEFLDELGRVLSIPRERFVDITSGGKDWFTSALPYTLHAIEKQKLAKPGDVGLVINVGSGLQVGCATYYF
jgi:3-oxoacyl-[acyl-carrier-protein] synthase III